MGVDVLQPAGQPVTISGTVQADVTDRAARLVGIIYGSRGQLLQTPSAGFPAAVELQTGATLYDARQIRALTAADVVSAVLSAGGTIDVTDRAGRLVGVVTVDTTNPLSVLDSSTATRRWQDAVFELLNRQLELLELIAVAVA